jgi:succinoglycan biosynthesis transport protein ExoP
MPEDFEEQPREPFDLSRYLDLVRRRHLEFLIPLLLGWLAVWGLSWLLPPRYKSTTQILVEQPSVPKDYVVSNIGDDIEDRLQSIQQQIESRTRLLLIIDKFHLYESKHRSFTPDEKVARMIKDIKIDLVRNTGNGAINAFQVSYSAPSPRLAQEVTSELTGQFIHENQRTLEQESEATTKFMEHQLESARDSLSQQEARVREFQTAHQGELPSQEASNLQILSGLQSQLQNEQDALNTARQQRIYYQSLIDQYRTLPAAAKGPEGAPTGLAAIDQKLAQLRGELAELTTRYTDQYPAVQNMKSEIAKTEALRKQAVAELSAHATAARGANAASATDAEGVAASAPLLQLQSQLQANQTEITNREQEIAQLKARIDSYQARLNAEPTSEAQLADLTRGYEQSQNSYNDLLKKKNDSAMATSMEKMQEGERFSVLDPPSLPTKPDFPNRLKFCGMGLGAGLVLGLIFAGGLEFFDDRLHNEKDIVKMLPTVIISEIPEVQCPSDLRRGRRRLALGWSVAAIVFTAIVVGSVLSYLHA